MREWLSRVTTWRLAPGGQDNFSLRGSKKFRDRFASDRRCENSYNAMSQGRQS